LVALNNAIWTFLGDGHGGFQLFSSYTAAIGESVDSIAVADIDRDGHMDIVTTGSDAIPRISYDFLGNSHVTSPLPVPAYDDEFGIVKVTELNGDGIQDIVGTTNDGGISVLLGLGNRSFQSLRHFAGLSNGTYAGPFPMAVADLNADGKP